MKKESWTPLFQFMQKCSVWCPIGTAHTHGNFRRGALKMFDLPNLSIRVESPETEDVSDLITRAEDTDISSLEELRAPNAEVLVARIDGRAVGCIALLDHLRYGEAKRLYVDASARGQGIAAALVSALEAAARDLGIGRITIASDTKQMAPELMQRFGFQLAEAAKAPGQAFLEKRL